MTNPINFERISMCEIHLPLVSPFRTAHGETTTRRVILLHGTDTDGADAWSECVALDTPGYLPETLDSAWEVIRKVIVPIVLGRPFDHPSEVSTDLEAKIQGSEMARASVEMLAWGLYAERSGESLARMLGGTREKVSTGVAIGMKDDLDTLQQDVTAALHEGYARVKLKIEPGRDIEPLTAICKAVGGGERISVDANGSYTLQHHATFIQLDDLGLMMIEQPLERGDLAGHAALQADLGTPLCLDESILSPADATRASNLRSARVMNIKPGRVGGLTNALAIHDFCHQVAIPVWCGGMLETGIGRAYNVALAALPNFSLPGDLSPSRRYWERDVVSPEWVMDAQGNVGVPYDRPGIGMDVDVEQIHSLTVRRETWSA